MPTPPLPIGWPLLPTPNDQGELVYPSLEASVRQSIQVILTTRAGEQLMHPLFGAGLPNYLHEPNNPTTRHRIREVISEAITQYEPRIFLDRVDVLEVPNEPTHIRIEIAYRLRFTGAAQLLGLTLMLEF